VLLFVEARNHNGDVERVLGRTRDGRRHRMSRIQRF
jgi:hypothetical protein